MSDTEPVWTAEEVARIQNRALAISMYQDPDKLAALLAERDALAARLDAVRELHQRVAPEVACIHCGRRWPCPTIRVLDNREDPNG